MKKYIDADELHEIINWTHLRPPFSKKRVHRFIDACRTADVRENVHGEWKHIGGDEWCCSSCGYIVTTDGSWEHPKDIGNLFCEHCGADMRGSE